MSLRLDFVTLASQEDANVRELCRQFGISPNTAYKWLVRYQAAGPAGLADQSRRPANSPGQTAPVMEQLVLATRQAHPAWGGRKLKAYLERTGHLGVPAASTITAILRRQGAIDAQESAQHRAFQRFERPAPNELWQMDFKGHFALGDRSRCHPLTILDDHARFLLALVACDDETRPTVQTVLTAVFERYGLPERILCDHGPPWGAPSASDAHTGLSVWLLRLGIGIVHGRPAHPQTQGKDERLHRTLRAELLAQQTFADLAACQPAFDAWRQMYNEQRPHEALALQVPADCYQPSPRPWPARLPPIQYPPEDRVRRVQGKGQINVGGHEFRIGKAFIGYPLGLRSTGLDGCYDVYFCQHCIAQIQLAAGRRI
jgi:transposase InsO family protein